MRKLLSLIPLLFLSACGPDYVGVGSYQLDPKSVVIRQIGSDFLSALAIDVADTPNLCASLRDGVMPKKGLQLRLVVGGTKFGTYSVDKQQPSPGSFVIDSSVSFYSWGPDEKLLFSEDAVDGTIEVQSNLNVNLHVHMSSGSLVEHQLQAHTCI